MEKQQQICVNNKIVFIIYVSFDIKFPTRGKHQSACVDGGPPDMSVLGVNV